MESTLGVIVTFCSYEGGVERSMALANVACLFTQKKNVNGDILMIDWNLDAPGLHQFFNGRFENPEGKLGNLLQGQLGLIDLFYEIRDRLEKTQSDSNTQEDIFDAIDINKYITKTSIPSLFFMPAGRNDDGMYSMRLNNFDWAVFFYNFPLIIPQFAQYLRKKYQFVLIDSRTGYTDISGICTSIMPEKLVAVFTPNLQSRIGIIELIRRAIGYRKQSDDLRPLMIFPLALRINDVAGNLQNEWRFGNPHSGVEGYQTQFEDVFKEVYNLQGCDLTEYFDEYQLQYDPKYFFGGEIVVLSQRSEDRFSVAWSLANIAELIISNINPIADRRLKVFLCHAHVDRDVVYALYTRLTQDAVDAWLDKEKLLPGQDWELEIRKAVREADVVVVCLSKQFNKAGFRQKEVKWALDTAMEKTEAEIFIIPARLEECDNLESLRRWHWVDLFDKNGYETLIRALRSHADKIGAVLH
jgi:MinD-like ATPase involved in chromosome partitioning or flagellar assembly